MDAVSDEQRTAPIGTFTQKMACQPGPRGQGAADQDASRDAEASHGSPHGERGLALAAGDGCHDQRECRGCKQGRAEALDGAAEDSRFRCRRTR